LATQVHAELLFYDGFGLGGNQEILSSDNLLGADSKTWVRVDVPGGFSFPDFQLRYDAPQPGDVSYFFPSNVPLPYAAGVTQRLNEYGNSMHHKELSDRTINLGADGLYFLSFILRSFLPDSDGEATISFVAPSAALHFGYRFSDCFTIATSAWNEMAYQGAYIDSSTTYEGNTTYFLVVMIEASANGPDKIYLKAYNAGSDEVASSERHLNGSGSDVSEWTVISEIESEEVFDRIGINSSGIGYFTLDEIRVGTTWQDVTGLSESENP
jgi:hypothetical protein